MPKTGVVEVQMPQMGESVTEGIILEWHVSEGDTIAEGDTIVEVSTDKIDAEVPAPAAGVVTKLLAAVDDTVQVGQSLAEIDEGASGNGAGSAGEPAEQGGEGDGGSNLVMGGGEGDEDLGDDSVPSESSQPGVIASSAPKSVEDAESEQDAADRAEPSPSADPAAPGRIAAEPGSPVADAPCEEAGGTFLASSIASWRRLVKPRKRARKPVHTSRNSDAWASTATAPATTRRMNSEAIVITSMITRRLRISE
jgi:pyruvate/2-oxoglutarate dehydrogenase complex dihydrolipoamide acyltransferase (E2) component